MIDGGVRHGEGPGRRAPRWAVLLLAAGLLAGCQSVDGLGPEPDEPSVGRLFSGTARERETAKAYFRNANFGLAEKTFREVLRKDPKDGEAWMGLGAAYDRLGRFDLADKAYEKAVAVAGRRPELLNNMGYSYLLRGDAKKAETTFREALALAPENPTLAANLKLLESL